MTTISVGFQVSCGSVDHPGMDTQGSRDTFRLSFQFPGMKEPVYIDVEVNGPAEKGGKGDDTDTIAARIARAVTKAVKEGKLTQEDANKIEVSVGYDADVKPQDGVGTPLTGTRPTGGRGRGVGGTTTQSPVSTSGGTSLVNPGTDPQDVRGGFIGRLTVTGCDAFDVGCTSGKVNIVFDTVPDAPRLPGTVSGIKLGCLPPAQGGPGWGARLARIDCAKYLNAQAEAKKAGRTSTADSLAELLCKRRAWRRVLYTITIQHEPPGWSHSGTRPRGVPIAFERCADSPRSQLDEIATRLVAAGIEVEWVGDVLVPVRFARSAFGVLPGTGISSFSMHLGLDPYGLTGPFPWQVVVGDPAAVARHAAGPECTSRSCVCASSSRHRTDGATPPTLDPTFIRHALRPGEPGLTRLPIAGFEATPSPVLRPDADA